MGPLVIQTPNSAQRFLRRVGSWFQFDFLSGEELLGETEVTGKREPVEVADGGFGASGMKRSPIHEDFQRLRAFVVTAEELLTKYDGLLASARMAPVVGSMATTAPLPPVRWRPR